MTQSPLYVAAWRSVFPFGRSASLVVTRDDGHVVELDALASRVLALCQGGKTLDAHAALAWQSGATGNPSALSGALDRLLDMGLLRPWEEARRSDTAPSGLARRPLETVAVITANRPAMLRRCLNALADHADAFGRRLRFLVIDGSRDEAGRRDSRAVAAAIDEASAHAVTYIGREAAEALQRRLAGSAHVAPAVLSGFMPGQIGMSRNLAVLLAAGNRLLMVDDDVICDPWARADCAGGVALGGHADLREWAFFNTREDAFAAAGPATVNLLAVHNQLLGATLDDVRPPPDLAHACWHQIDAMAGRRSLAVRATFAGVAGDAGMYCPTDLLFLPGAVRQTLVESRAVFDRALSSREVHRIATQTLVTHEPFCMAYCMGLAGETILPPFMPVGRNEDGVFGAMLGFADPAAAFGHLPYGILHDSGRPAAYGDERVRSARETRVSELLHAITRSQSSSTAATTASDRLRALGRRIRELSAMVPRDFSAFVCDALLGRRCQQISRLEADLAAMPACPDYYRAAFGEYRQTFRERVTDRAFLLPVEFKSHRSIEEGFGDLQAYLGRFGELLDAWPAIWETARNLERS